jgi:hypothetical protein
VRALDRIAELAQALAPILEDAEDAGARRPLESQRVRGLENGALGMSQERITFFS